MRTQNQILGMAAVVIASLGLVACGGSDGSAAPTATVTVEATSTPTPTPAPTTEVIELNPFLGDGSLADGWVLDESTLADGQAPADWYESRHGTGPNTVTCGPTAASLAACWLTEDSTQIACLDQYEPVEQKLRLIALDGQAPAKTPTTEDPAPLWVELDDGSTFAAVHGGAWSPPEGYRVAYVRTDDTDTVEEILVPDDDPANTFDESEGLWKVTVGEDGGSRDVESKRVVKAWFMAGRELPENNGDELSAEIINGRWCPTEDSQQFDTHGCVSIAYPTATYDDGFTASIVDAYEADGTISYSLSDAPFGTYMPAGLPIDAPYDIGFADQPDQDRIWNSQSGPLLVRE